MASLKTTIILDSKDILLNPLLLRSVDTEEINSDWASLISNEIQPSNTEILLETDDASGDSAVVYLYCESAKTNSNFGIDIYLTQKSTPDVTMHFARLLSGNAAFLPIYAADLDGIRIDIKNNDPVNSANVKYFYGSKD
jgi:hypothetical protein